MSNSRRIAAAFLLAGAGLVFVAPGAGAHALLHSSDPPDGATLSASPDVVTLTFTEDPEITLTNVRVLDTSGGSHEAGKPAQVPAQPRTIRVRVKELPKGIYTVAWRVVSRVDGHATGGAFAFGVGVSPADQPRANVSTPVTPPISPAEVAGRWLLYAGLLGLVGSAWVSVWAFSATPGSVLRFMAAAFAASVAGFILLGLAQRAAAGVSFGDLLSTPIGRALAWRAAGIGAAGLMLAGSTRLKERGSRLGIVVAGAAAAAALLAHVEAGHAAASEPVWRNVASQFVHVLAAGVWVGGLAALLFGIRGAAAEARARAVRRFSAAAGIALAVVAITGTVRALAEIGSWDGLFSSTYGRLVIAKAVLIVGLAALGAVNRYRNVPRAGTELSGLRRVSRGELALAALALAAAGGLASSSPPADASVAPRAPDDRIVAVASDFARTVRVRLEVAPGFAGPNTFAVRLTEPDSGEPLEAARVALRFRFPDAAVGESEIEMTRTAKGRFRGDGTNLSLDGPWTVTVIIQQTADSFEIPIELQTRCRAEAVPVSGGPTLHNVRLPDGTAQLYVDPGTAGLNQVHITFFDPTGRELPVAEIPSMVGTHDRVATPFEVRRFGPGHFVADATLAAGDWRFAFSGTIPGATQVRGCFDQTVG